MTRRDRLQAWLLARVIPTGYVPDIEAHRKHDEAVLFAAHPANFHVWIGTADGQVCSFCQRVRDWTEPETVPQAEEYPLFLTPTGTREGVA